VEGLAGAVISGASPGFFLPLVVRMTLLLGYRTFASKTPVSTVEPCFIWMKMR